MRRTTWIATLGVLVGSTFSPLRAETIARWVRVAHMPEVAHATEAIPTPQQLPGDCPTLQQLGYHTKRLAELNLNVGIDDQQLPVDCSEGVFHVAAQSDDGRDWFDTEFNWAASDLFAQPAYFDDPVLERYGQTRRPLVQPWLSGAHFFGQFPLMP